MSKHEKKRSRLSPYLVPDTSGDKPFPTSGRSGLEASALNLRDVLLDSWMAHGARNLMVPRFDPVEGYSPIDDPRLANDPEAKLALIDSMSGDETDYRYRQLIEDRERKRMLQSRGASWSYLAAEFFDPINYIPLAGLAGVGFKQGAKLGAVGIGALSVGQEALRLGTDPLYTKQEAVTNIATSALFGAVVGGALGRFLKLPGQPFDPNNPGIGNAASAAHVIEARARLDDVVERQKHNPAVYDLGQQQVADAKGNPTRVADTVTMQAAKPKNAPEGMVLGAVDKTGEVKGSATNSIDDAVLRSEGRQPAALVPVKEAPKLSSEKLASMFSPGSYLLPAGVKILAEELAKVAANPQTAKVLREIAESDESVAIKRAFEAGLINKASRFNTKGAVLSVALNTLDRLRKLADGSMNGAVRFVPSSRRNRKRPVLEVIENAPTVGEATHVVKRAPDGTPGEVKPVSQATKEELDAAKKGGTAPDGSKVDFMRRLADSELDDVLGIRKGSDVHEALIKSAEARVERLRRGAREAQDRLDTLRKVAHATARKVPKRAEKELESVVGRLTQDADALEKVIVKERLAASDALAHDGDVSVSTIQPTGVGLEKLHWSELPYFLLKNNKLGELSEKLAHEVRLLADEISGAPGLQMLGASEGVTTLPSAEASVWQWHAVYKGAASTMESAYLKYLGESAAGNVGRSVFFKRVKQDLIDPLSSGVASGARRLAGRPARPNAVPDKLTYRQFREMIGRALANNDTIPANVPKDAVPHLQESIAAWRKVIVDMGQEMEALGILRSRRTAQKQIEKFDTEIGTHEAVLAARENELLALRKFDVGQPDEAKFAIEDALVEKVRKILEREPTRQDLVAFIMSRRRQIARDIEYHEGKIAEAEALKGELVEWLVETEGREQIHFPRMFRPDLIQQNEEVVKDLLRRHFRKNPVSIRIDRELDPKTGEPSGPIRVRRVGHSLEDDELEERVEAAYAHLLREVDHTNEAATQEKILDRMRDAVANAAAALAHAKRQIPKSLSEGVIEGTRFEKVVDDLGNEVLGKITWKKAGTAIVHINREAIAREYKNPGPLSNLGVDVVDGPAFWREKYGIKSEEELVKFVEEHERAHARLWRRHADETLDEFERRVNQEALRVFRGGKIETEDVQRLTLKFEGLKRRLAEMEAMRHGSTRAQVGRRSIDVDTRDFLDFVETDVEVVMTNYIKRMAPRIEIARRFGDHMMERRLGELVRSIDNEINRLENETNMPQLEFREEKERVLQAAADLRDKVVGVYGFPEDPSAWSVRALEMARSFSVITVMGKAWLASLVDTGKVIWTEGLTRSFGAVFDSFAKGTAKDSGIYMAREEANLAGVVSEMTFATKAAAMLDLGPQVYGRSRIEQQIHQGAGKMFILNGLALWTDVAKSFAGGLASSRIIEYAARAAEGKATQKQLEALSRAGISKEVAKLIAMEWRNAGGKVVDGLHIANTTAWRNPEVQRLFRAALAQEVNTIILTPGAADKLNFMSKPLGATILQYRGFAMAATWRIAASALQQRDKAALSGILALVALGILVDKIKRPDWVEPNVAQTVWRGIEISGVMGIVTDINAAIEAASGQEFGISPLLDFNKTWNSTNWATRMGVLGPAAYQWANLAYALFDPSATGNQQARALRYMVPFSNHLLWDDAFRRTQRELGQFLGGDQ